MNEFDLIAKLRPLLTSNSALVRGAGDDCAVLDLGLPNQLVLFKTDAVVESVHFTSETPAAKVGRKAIARCLSDLAAMGGKPVSALISLGLPSDFDPSKIEQMYAGMREISLEWGLSLAGGETVKNPAGMFVSISMLGLVAKGKVPNRAGAKAGDAIFVTGELGGSIEGKHLDFEPRLKEGQWLANEFPLHSMIDLSDGLAGDLRHILNSSGVGAELLATMIPIARAARQRAKANGSKPPLLAALTDGEDFELLFTLAPRHAVELKDRWRATFPKLKLSCIGKVQAEPGLRLRDKDGLKTIGFHGYTHFS